MLTYTATYRVPAAWFSTKLKKVVGDGIESALGFRFFALQDGTMVYIPLASEVVFSPERSIAIAKKMSQESGLNIQPR